MEGPRDRHNVFTIEVLPIYLTIVEAKNIVRYTEDFVIKRFVIQRYARLGNSVVRDPIKPQKLFGKGFYIVKCL